MSTCVVNTWSPNGTATIPYTGVSTLDGTAANFAVTSVTGVGTITYQWWKGGVLQVGETNSTYAPTLVFADNLDVIACVVEDDNGPATDQPVFGQVSVYGIAPTIAVTQSGGTLVSTGHWSYDIITVPVGGAITFTATHNRGTTPIDIIWNDSTATPTATAGQFPYGDTSPQTYITGAFATGEAGLIQARFRSSYGSFPGVDKSGTDFMIFTEEAPVIEAPASATITTPIGSVANMYASVVNWGIPGTTYQWKKNGDNVTSPSTFGRSPTSANYATNPLPYSADGDIYTCLVTNSYGSTLSDPITIAISDTPVNPVADVQPASQEIPTGATAYFFAGFSGSLPMTFQWYKNSVAISGATSADYTTPTNTIANHGDTYYVIATNEGASTQSSSAILTIEPGSGLSVSGYVADVAITYTAEAATTGMAGNTFAYAWAFDDATTDTGASVSKTWATTGDHLATVTATDQVTGVTATDTKTIYLNSGIPPYDNIAERVHGHLGGGRVWVVMGTDFAYSYVPKSNDLKYWDMVGMYSSYANDKSSGMTADGLYIVATNNGYPGTIQTVNTTTGAFSIFTIDTGDTTTYGPNAASLAIAQSSGRMTQTMVGIDDKILIFWGSSFYDLGWTMLFDPATQTMETVDYGVHKNRGGFAAFLGSDGFAYCLGVGGIAKANVTTMATTTIAAPTGYATYFPDWAVPYPVVVGDKAYIMGGSSGGGASMDVVIVFDVTAPSTAVTDAITIPDGYNYEGMAVQLNDGRIFICGGGSSAVINPGTLRAGGYIFNPSNNSFTATENDMFVPRMSHAMATLPNGLVMIVGGLTYSTVPAARIEFFNPYTNMFQTTE